MTLRITAVLALTVAVTGCAGVRGAALDGDSMVAASPGPALTGTWTGMAWAVPGSAYFVSTPVTLTIHPDGAWQWSARGDAVQGRGTVTRAGTDRVVLQEQSADTAEDRITLRRSGTRLWGMSQAFLSGHPTAVDLHRTHP
ncbi:MAG: hypothetical protein FJ027_05220 [Candidatus Rokubacteria bacterium]|nr:hypothetical protein [Candidatus Rokubacteria bacterium]